MLDAWLGARYGMFQHCTDIDTRRIMVRLAELENSEEMMLTFRIAILLLVALAAQAASIVLVSSGGGDFTYAFARRRLFS